MGAGNGLLRLNHFQIIGDPGGETIARLGKSLFRQFDGTAGNFDLLGGGIQVEQERCGPRSRCGRADRPN